MILFKCKSQFSSKYRFNKMKTDSDFRYYLSRWCWCRCWCLWLKSRPLLLCLRMLWLHFRWQFYYNSDAMKISNFSKLSPNHFWLLDFRYRSTCLRLVFVRAPLWLLNFLNFSRQITWFTHIVFNIQLKKKSILKLITQTTPYYYSIQMCFTKLFSFFFRLCNRNLAIKISQYTAENLFTRIHTLRYLYHHFIHDE